MKRAKTLTAGILGTIGHFIISILLLVAFVQLLDYLEYGDLGGVLALIFILTAISIVGLEMSIITIIVWNKNTTDFRKKYGVIITGVVADFILAIYSLISLFEASGGIILLWLFMVALFIIAPILKIVDLATENKKAKPKLENKKLEENPQTTNIQAATELEEKLTKLNNMKEHGLITEQEYSEIKSSYIKEYLK